jgi:hypothetical protein
MKKTQALFWVGEARRGRENISDEERPGRPPTARLDEILAYCFERDPQQLVDLRFPWGSRRRRLLLTCTKGLE